MKRYLTTILILMLLVLAGCSSTKNQVTHKDRYIITADEIAGVPGAQNAMELVRMLRPGLLERDKARYTGLTPPLQAMVYLNGTRMGSKDKLRGISNMNIQQIQYIDGIEATTRYGTDASGGVFFVTVKHNIGTEQDEY
jgi:hypothetical protein